MYILMKCRISSGSSYALESQRCIMGFLLNPFMPNVFSHHYQFGESISNLRVGWLVVFLLFYSNFKRQFCKQTVENLIRRRVLWRLIWFCTVCRCPTKKTLGLYGLTDQESNVSRIFINTQGNQIFYHAFPNLETQISK